MGHLQTIVTSVMSEALDTPVSRRLASVKNIIIVLSGKGESAFWPHHSRSHAHAVQAALASRPRLCSWLFRCSTCHPRHGWGSLTSTLPVHPSREWSDSTFRAHLCTSPLQAGSPSTSTRVDGSVS